MGKHKRSQVTEFSFEGRFLGFITEDGYKLKRVRLSTATGEHSIKLSKESRAALGSLGLILKPGDWVHVSGEQKLNAETQAVKFKAYQITPIAPKYSETSAAPVIPAPASVRVPAKASVLVCQKSDCWKRGGKAVCQALEASLSDRGLEEQVAIKGTGCMKHCKAGPNIVFMPDKTRYSRIHPEEVSALVDKHFPLAVQPAASTTPLAEELLPVDSDLSVGKI